MNIQPMIDVGIRLQEIIEAKDYGSLLQVLDKIIIPEGSTLQVKLYKLKEDEFVMGANSTIELVFPDGTSILGGDKSNIRTYITAENSEMGAWQLFLLYNLHSYLPMFWHALYGERAYMYTRQQLEKLKILPNKFAITKKPFCIDDYDVTPVIEREDNRYRVVACFWSDFGGLYRQTVTIEFKKNGSMKLKESRRKRWYYYELMINY